jgi:hypothetical protein
LKLGLFAASKRAESGGESKVTRSYVNDINVVHMIKKRGRSGRKRPFFDGGEDF